MAKGVHSKRRKRNQSIKRKVLEEKIFRPRLKETSSRLLKRTFGRGDDLCITNKKNAFRFPKDPTAVFPQQEKPVYIDKRSAYIPREYLIKNRGEKVKNIKKREREEKLLEEIKKIDGKQREDQIIDLDKVNDIDEIAQDISEMDMDSNFNKKKKIKKKERTNTKYKMDIEKPNTQVSKSRRKTKREKKKSKSYYIVNF